MPRLETRAQELLLPGYLPPNRGLQLRGTEFLFYFDRVSYGNSVVGINLSRSKTLPCSLPPHRRLWPFSVPRSPKCGTGLRVTTAGLRYRRHVKPKPLHEGLGILVPVSPAGGATGAGGEDGRFVDRGIKRDRWQRWCGGLQG